MGNLLWGAGNLGKIRSACGPHEIRYAKRRMNKYGYDYMYNFACVFIHHVQWECTDCNRKNRWNMKFTTKAGVSLFFYHIFTKITTTLMYDSTNRDHEFSKLLRPSVSALPEKEKMSSDFKCLRGQHNIVSRATCSPRTTGWVGPVYTSQWYI